MNLQGVGSGSVQARCELQTPIAVPTPQGNAETHSISMPIVDGPGAQLPGLLGMKTMAAHRAILDTHGRSLIFPGPGAVDIVLPPGSTVVPLEKTPSGHLAIVIVAYEQQHQPEGLPPSSLHPHSSLRGSNNIDPTMDRPIDHGRAAGTHIHVLRPSEVSEGGRRPVKRSPSQGQAGTPPTPTPSPYRTPYPETRSPEE